MKLTIEEPGVKASQKFRVVEGIAEYCEPSLRVFLFVAFRDIGGRYQNPC
jgi:hypothetical protein